MNGLNKISNNTLKHMVRSPLLNKPRMKKENMLLSAMDQMTNLTVSMDPVVLTAQFKK